jgi:hypothetical protein
MVASEMHKASAMSGLASKILPTNKSMLLGGWCRCWFIGSKSRAN